MSNPDHLSVIIPTTDGFEAIRSHVQKLDIEDAHKVELIIVSPDTSLDEAALTEGIRFHSAKLILGNDVSHCDAINMGAHAATGAAFTWLNVDDHLSSSAVPTALKALSSAPEDAIVYGRATRKRQDGREDAYPVATTVSRDTLFQSCSLSQPATWITPGAFRKVGQLRTRFECAFDYEFWIRAVSKGVPFQFVDEVLAEMDIRPEAKSFDRRARVFQEHCEVMLLHYGRCPPAAITSLWAEALSPSEAYRSVSVGLLRDAGATIDSIAAAADRAGDDQTLQRLETDARLRFLACGVAADMDRQGRLPDRAQMRIRTDKLPMTMLFRLETPPDSPDDVALLLQSETRQLPSSIYTSVGFMAARIEEDAAIGADGYVDVALLSTSPVGAKLVDVW